MSKVQNIMDTLTPKPPFNAAKKNSAVVFPAFPPAVGQYAKSKIITGTDRTVCSLKK